MIKTPVMDQSPAAIIMVRPNHFGYNYQTATTNAFQILAKGDHGEIAKNARLEFDDFALQLTENGIDTMIFEENDPQTPDAIFPNNWISFHHNGEVVLYSLFADNRRRERRDDILSQVEKKFQLGSILDLTIYEKENKFLEGTGSIVFDYKNKIAYANRSPRSHDDLFYICCQELDFEPMLFTAKDKNGQDIYHTNVLMAIADSFAIVCTDCIHPMDRERVITSLRETGHKIIDISYDQMLHFPGNAIQLSNDKGQRFLVMSKAACLSLKPEQKLVILDSCEIIYSDLSTIETYGGGSARCMIAGIFLPVKNR